MKPEPSLGEMLVWLLSALVGVHFASAAWGWDGLAGATEGAAWLVGFTCWPLMAGAVRGGGRARTPERPRSANDNPNPPPAGPAPTVQTGPCPPQPPAMWTSQTVTTTVQPSAEATAVTFASNPDGTVRVTTATPKPKEGGS